MKFPYLFLSVVFIFAALYGCSSSKTIDLPDLGIPVDELNRDLVIDVEPGFNSFKIGQCVDLTVYLKSEIEVRATEHFNARLFVLSSEKSDWQEVQEVPDLDIFEPFEIVMSQKEGSLNFTHHSVCPSISNQSNPIQLLVLITGDVYKDGQNTGKKVGAYTVATLKP